MSFWHRIYSDFLLPSRMKEYSLLLNTAITNGYQFLTIPDYFERLQQNKINSTDKIFIHRHDIDTDPATARKFFEAEQECGVKTSYYFRKQNLDIRLFNDVSEAGHEAGYHYEELSDYCKEKNIHSVEEIKSHYNEIESRFLANLLQIEKKVGRKITSIAAHGDFVNRKLNLPNYSFITSEIMKKAGLHLECYNPVLLNSFGYIGSDIPYPKFYHPHSPFEALENGVTIIYFLSHPRHWRSNISINLKDNVQRVIEGRKYQPK
jgi:hypothetical protein